MFKTIAIISLFFFSLSVFSKTADTPICDFKMYWGHTQILEESPVSIIKPIQNDLAKGDVTVVGQGCMLGERGGNLKGMRKSYGVNGDWVSKLNETNNGGFNPINSIDELPFHLKDRIREIRLINKEIAAIDKKIKSFFRKATDEDLKRREELTNLNEKHQRVIRRYNKTINAVGFYKLTQHNWMTLISSAIENATEGDQPCSKVNISFNCRYQKSNIYNQQYWDLRIKTATETDITLDSTGPIAQELRHCAQLATDNGLVSIYNVPRECGQSVSLTREDLIKVYNGCKDLFDK